MPAPPLPPLPPAPTASTCPNPVPTAGLTGWGMHPHVPAGYWDVTPLTHGREYCESVGLGTMPDGFSPRADCAVRVDMHPERLVCEALILGGNGKPSWSCDMVPRVRGGGGKPDVINPYLGSCGNPAALWITVCGNLPGALCRSCKVSDPSNCFDWRL